MKTQVPLIVTRVAASTCIALSIASVASAQITTAFDFASDPAYLTGWQDGDNGSFGFQPWQFLPCGNNPLATPLISTSVLNSDGCNGLFFGPKT